MSEEGVPAAFAQWTKANGDLFRRLELAQRRLSLANDEPIATLPTNLAQIAHPAISFLTSRPSSISRLPYPAKPATANPPNRDLFKLDAASSSLPATLPEIIAATPPLISIFPDADTAPPAERRQEVLKLKSPDVNFLTLKYQSLTAAKPLFEPIIVTAFLWDPARRVRLTEQWRFPVVQDSELSAEPKLRDLIGAAMLKAPTQVSFPVSPKHQNAQFIVSLERLVLQEGGADLAKYYSGSKQASAMKSLFKTCEQPNTSMTFAWMSLPLSQLQGSVVLNKFLSASSVSDDFLTSPGEKGSPVQMELKLQVGASGVDDKSLKLRHFFNYPESPHLTFINELIVRPDRVNFTFPPELRGRNIIIEFQFFANGKIQPLANGETTYTTRCQYHQEAPVFCEEFVLPLPTVLPPDARLDIKFLHASVKPKCKQPREPCGSATFPLVTSGLIVADGDHAVGITYPVGQQPGLTDRNRLAIKTILRSCLFSSDRSVAAVLSGTFDKLEAIPIPKLLPHLFPVLDRLIAAISEGKPRAFESLLGVLRGFSPNRTAPEDSQYLAFYVRAYALRQPGLENFLPNFIKEWHVVASAQTPPQGRADLVVPWFLLELLVKASLVREPPLPELERLVLTISGAIPALRQSPGTRQLVTELNRHLAFFYRDLYEVAPAPLVLKLVHAHLAHLGEGSAIDAPLFADLFANFLSPKVFVHIIAPLTKRSSLFDDIFIPRILAAVSSVESANAVFSALYETLRQFTPAEHVAISERLARLVTVVSAGFEAFSRPGDRVFAQYLLTVVHYVLYYNEKLPIPETVAVACGQVVALSHRLAPPDIMAMEQAARSLGRTAVSFCPTFDALSVCIQSVMLRIVERGRKVFVLGAIGTRLMDVDMPAGLKPLLRTSVVRMVQAEPNEVFKGGSIEGSPMAHIIKGALAHLDAGAVEMLDIFMTSEKSVSRTSNRCIALITRALAKVSISQQSLACLDKTQSFYAPLVRAVCAINQQMAAPGVKEQNPDVYADLLFQKAALLSRSPDARVHLLLELSTYHLAKGYGSEAVVAQLTAAAVVSEYMQRLARLPRDLCEKLAARNFALACPAAAAEECPAEVTADLPRLKGFCTSKYFSEYGLILLLFRAIQTCKQVQLFELSHKIQVVLSPLAEFRALWQLMQDRFAEAKRTVKAIAAMTADEQRSLGTYYRVQFPDGRNFIYRETALANLWQVGERLKSSGAFYAGGRPVEIVNEGEKLKDEALLPTAEKYAIHVKAVQQHFTAEDRKTRVTVFEQNHNVAEFYFDIPMGKGAQASIEHCWLRRTVFTLPYPIPYIVKRVEVPPGNIRQFDFSPIEYSCQNLQLQIDRVEAAIGRRDFKSLQPLIQGTLLTQVNEGPKKMAEVFLVGGESEDIKPEHVQQLRALFRLFIKVFTSAVTLHSQYAHENPVYATLQEMLETGLTSLSSSLQPYLS
jgi:hypothetical protein